MSQPLKLRNVMKSQFHVISYYQRKITWKAQDMLRFMNHFETDSEELLIMFLILLFILILVQINF